MDSKKRKKEPNDKNRRYNNKFRIKKKKTNTKQNKVLSNSFLSFFLFYSRECTCVCVCDWMMKRGFLACDGCDTWITVSREGRILSFLLARSLSRLFSFYVRRLQYEKDKKKMETNTEIGGVQFFGGFRDYKKKLLSKVSYSSSWMHTHTLLASQLVNNFASFFLKYQVKITRDTHTN